MPHCVYMNAFHISSKAARMYKTSVDKASSEHKVLPAWTASRQLQNIVNPDTHLARLGKLEEIPCQATQLEVDHWSKVNDKSHLLIELRKRRECTQDVWATLRVADGAGKLCGEHQKEGLDHWSIYHAGQTHHAPTSLVPSSRYETIHDVDLGSDDLVFWGYENFLTTSTYVSHYRPHNCKSTRLLFGMSVPGV